MTRATGRNGERDQSNDPSNARALQATTTMVTNPDRTLPPSGSILVLLVRRFAPAADFRRTTSAATKSRRRAKSRASSGAPAPVRRHLYTSPPRRTDREIDRGTGTTGTSRTKRLTVTLWPQSATLKNYRRRKAPIRWMSDSKSSQITPTPTPTSIEKSCARK